MLYDWKYLMGTVKEWTYIGQIAAKLLRTASK